MATLSRLRAVLSHWDGYDAASIARAARAQLAERSLAAFIKLMWRVLHPATPLVWGWAFDALCIHLEAVTRGEIRKLLINIPPGFMKSLIVNVFWPAWVWARGMVTSYLSGSHKEDLAERDSLKLRTLVTSELYQSMWGDRVKLSKDQAGKKRFNLVNTGFNAVSSSRSMTGDRANRIKLDDPHSIEGAESDAERLEANRVFAETVPSRLAQPETDAIIVIMQRVHEEDVSALAIELGFVHLCLPMEFEADHPHRWVGKAANENQYGPGDPRTKEGELLCEARYSVRAVEELKAQLRVLGGDYAVASQLQQRPAPRGGGMFKREWLVGNENAYIVEPHLVPAGGVECRGWDLGYSNGKNSDPTEGVKIRLVGGIAYIWDCRGGQLEPDPMEALIIATTEEDGRDCAQSIPRDPAAGAVLAAKLSKELHGYVFEFTPEKGDKSRRAQPLAAAAQAGNVRLVRGPWIAEFVRQATNFPNGKHDDKIDAASRAYAYVVQKRVRVTLPVGIGLIGEDAA
jgi:predicted phage terminase large subunit-like protein